METIENVELIEAGILDGFIICRFRQNIEFNGIRVKLFLDIRVVSTE